MLASSSSSSSCWRDPLFHASGPTPKSLVNSEDTIADELRVAVVGGPDVGGGAEDELLFEAVLYNVEGSTTIRMLAEAVRLWMRAPGGGNGGNHGEQEDEVLEGVEQQEQPDITAAVSGELNKPPSNKRTRSVEDIEQALHPLGDGDDHAKRYRDGSGRAAPSTAARGVSSGSLALVAPAPGRAPSKTLKAPSHSMDITRLTRPRIPATKTVRYPALQQLSCCATELWFSVHSITGCAGVADDAAGMNSTKLQWQTGGEEFSSKDVLPGTIVAHLLPPSKFKSCSSQRKTRLQQPSTPTGGGKRQSSTNMKQGGIVIRKLQLGRGEAPTANKDAATSATPAAVPPLHLRFKVVQRPGKPYAQALASSVETNMRPAPQNYNGDAPAPESQTNPSLNVFRSQANLDGLRCIAPLGQHGCPPPPAPVPRLRCFVFDMDDTLLESEKWKREIFFMVMESITPRLLQRFQNNGPFPNCDGSRAPSSEEEVLDSTSPGGMGARRRPEDPARPPCGRGERAEVSLPQARVVGTLSSFSTTSHDFPDGDPTAVVAAGGSDMLLRSESCAAATAAGGSSSSACSSEGEGGTGGSGKCLRGGGAGAFHQSREGAAAGATAEGGGKDPERMKHPHGGERDAAGGAPAQAQGRAGAKAPDEDDDLCAVEVTFRKQRKKDLLGDLAFATDRRACELESNSRLYSEEAKQKRQVYGLLCELMGFIIANIPGDRYSFFDQIAGLLNEIHFFNHFELAVRRFVSEENLRNFRAGGSWSTTNSCVVGGCRLDANGIIKKKNTNAKGDGGDSVRGKSFPIPSSVRGEPERMFLRQLEDAPRDVVAASASVNAPADRDSRKVAKMANREDVDDHEDKPDDVVEMLQTPPRNQISSVEEHRFSCSPRSPCDLKMDGDEGTLFSGAQLAREYSKLYLEVMTDGRAQEVPGASELLQWIAKGAASCSSSSIDVVQSGAKVFVSSLTPEADLRQMVAKYKDGAWTNVVENVFGKLPNATTRDLVNSKIINLREIQQGFISSNSQRSTADPDRPAQEPQTPLLHPSEMVVIGDSDSDLLSAREVGCWFIGVGDKLSAKYGVPEANVHRDCAKILDTLKQMSRKNF